MCGILGVISKESVSRRLIAGTERLQNRGERSVRVVTFDNNIFHSYGGLRPPTLQFFDFDAAQLPGAMGIAHTRYATVGFHDKASLLRNVQPVMSDRPGMATCNNGDLVNIYSQMNRLKEQGFSFQTQVDAKVIQNTLIRHMISSRIFKAASTDDYARILFHCVRNTMDDLVGAYSVLCLLETGLLAFKDSHGIRPLSCAHRMNEDGEIIEWGFSSESSVFNYFGDYHGLTELAPGEAVFVPLNNVAKPYRQRLKKEREAFCYFEFNYFARPDSNFKNRYVEIVRQDLGLVLAEEYAHLKDEIDIVCGLPGTAITTGLSFARSLGLPYHQAIIKVGNKRSFQETSDEKRRKAIDDKFIFIRDFINGRRIAVIDDSNVRGTTSKKIIQRLYSLGAKEVRFFYYTPEIIGPCYYGIDTPDQLKLIAYNKTNAEITAEMGCNGVHYISLKGLIRGLKIPKNRLCLACLTCEYPTPIKEAVDRVIARREERARAEAGS